MTLYAITKLSTDEDSWLLEAIWREADGQTNRYLSDEQRVLPAEIDRALGRGDVVNLMATSHAGSIIANELLERLTRDGHPAFRIQSQGEDALFRVERY